VSSSALHPLRVRIAEPADIEALVRLINAAFLVERFFIEGDRINAAAARKLMAAGQFLIAEDVAYGDDGISGCVYVEPRGDRAYLGLLSVNPSRQRSGLGSRLVVAAEDHARASGIHYMDLRIVNLRQELPDFYRRLGYVVTGTSSFSPDVTTKQPCNFINMSKALVSAWRLAETGTDLPICEQCPACGTCQCTPFQVLSLATGLPYTIRTRHHDCCDQRSATSPKRAGPGLAHIGG
jgi:N-acetylglutamate synthase-like GNAT family acetyltransferase